MIKIIQVLPQDSNRGVIGLGEDSKLYEWSFLQGIWILYQKGGNQKGSL